MPNILAHSSRLFLKNPFVICRHFYWLHFLACRILSMAVLDDKTWLLSFIRNQFIISDDTSICETVLGPDLDPEEPNTSTCNFLGSANHGASSSLSNGLAGVTEKRQRALSPDIVLESDGRSSRRRSNTAVRLEKIRKERDEKGRVQTTRWKARPAGTPRRTTTLQSQQSVEDLDSAFASVDVKARPDVPPRSLLSLKVEETAQVDIKVGKFRSGCWMFYCRVDWLIDRLIDWFYWFVASKMLIPSRFLSAIVWRIRQIWRTHAAELLYFYGLFASARYSTTQSAGSQCLRRGRRALFRFNRARLSTMDSGERCASTQKPRFTLYTPVCGRRFRGIGWRYTADHRAVWAGGQVWPDGLGASGERWHGRWRKSPWTGGGES